MRRNVLWLLAILVSFSCGGGDGGGASDTGAGDLGLDSSMPTDLVDSAGDAAGGDIQRDEVSLDLAETGAGDVDAGDTGGEDSQGDVLVDADTSDYVPPGPCEGQAIARVLVDEGDETFDLGPYLMQLEPTSVVVMWRTLEGSDGVVVVKPKAGGEELSFVDDSAGPIHEVEVMGLEADTDYLYQVESNGVKSAWHTMHTAVPKGMPFTFVAWGDNQNGPEIFKEVVKLMIGVGPHLAVGVGDHVQTGKNAELWKDELFGPARALFHQVPFYAAMGNHEQNAQHYRDLYSYPHPVDDPVHESYYWYTYGNAFFLVLDTNTLLCPLGEVDVPQSEFIKAALETPEAKNATWRIAYAHEPAYSESWSPGDCKYDGFLCVRNWVVPLLDSHEFHVWMSGHAHVYERGTVGGVQHLIIGGGGGGLDEWCKDWEQTSVVYQDHHFLSVEAGCDQLRIEGVNLSGEVFDWVVVNKEREIVEQGPVEGLPELIISSDAPK